MITKKFTHKISLKLGDEVKIITGKYKGKIGKIILLNKKKALAQLDTVNERERYYTKTEKQQIYKDPEKIKILEKKSIPFFIHISNLMILKNS